MTNPTALIIGEDAYGRAILAASLRPRGFDVEYVFESAAAEECIGTMVEAGVAPTLVFFPVVDEGDLLVLRRLSEDTCDAPIVAVLGEDMEHFDQLAKKAGAAVAIRTPLDPSLIGQLSAALLTCSRSVSFGRAV